MLIDHRSATECRPGVGILGQEAFQLLPFRRIEVAVEVGIDQAIAVCPRETHGPTSIPRSDLFAKQNIAQLCIRIDDEN